MAETFYNTIAGTSTGEFREKGSKFLSFAFPLNSEEQFRTILQDIKKEHAKANHHCYAFRLGPLKTSYRYSDDREPSGTAGKPIYGIILSHDLTNVLIVVVRYFGGTLLGVPGLIHAYRESAANSIARAQIIAVPITEQVKVGTNYEHIGELMELIRIARGKADFISTGDSCTLVAEFPPGYATPFSDKIRKDPRYRDKFTLYEE